VKEKVLGISEEEFNKFVESVRVKISQADLSINDETRRYWREIREHSYLFDRKEVNLEELKKVKKEEMINLFETVFFKRRKLVEVHVNSLDHIEANDVLKKERLSKESNTKQIVSLEWLKRRVPLYPDFNSQL
jgi:secreted Zn-dependent insulinase-like peptidase